MSNIEHFSDFLRGPEHLSGKNKALMWSIFRGESIMYTGQTLDDVSHGRLRLVRL